MAVLALVFGYLGRRQIDQSDARETGRSMAVAGIVLGWISIAVTVIFIFLLFAPFASREIVEIGPIEIEVPRK